MLKLKFVIGNRENLSGIISRNINTRFKHVYQDLILLTVYDVLTV